MATIFNRKDKHVQDAAFGLTLEEFQEKFLGQTSPGILKAVYSDIRRTVALKKAITEKTDEAVDLPAPAPTPTKKVFVAEDKTKVIISKKGTSTVVETDTQEVPKKGVKTETVIEEDGEEIIKVKTTSPEGSKTRAVRLRELIKDGKDKKAATAILVTEGYDVKTIHSEWSRLTK